MPKVHQTADRRRPPRARRARVDVARRDQRRAARRRDARAAHHLHGDRADDAAGAQVNLPQARRADAGRRRSRSTSPCRPTFSRTRIVQIDKDERADRYSARARASGDPGARRQVGVHPGRRRRRRVQESMTVMDKLKEGGRRKGRLDVQAGRNGSSACTKRSATFLIDRAREADGISRMVLCRWSRTRVLIAAVVRHARRAGGRPPAESEHADDDLRSAARPGRTRAG